MSRRCLTSRALIGIAYSFALMVATCRFERPSFADDKKNVWTVQKLNDNKGNEQKPWEHLIGSGIPFWVEGRMGSFSSGNFRLQKCEVRFTVDSAKLKFVESKSTVEIRGQFKKEGSKTEFAVDELKVVPSFADQFEARSSKLKRPASKEWIELGDWAAERARFYEDADLETKANEAYLNAIEVDYKLLKPSDAEGRFSLAKRIDDYKLSIRRKQELIHEGYQIQWQALQKTEPIDVNAWQRFAIQLGDQLKGASEPLKQVAPELKDAYEQDPIATYRKSNDNVRIQLHRLFFVSVMRKVILHDVFGDGRDGGLIADKIERLIPEERTIAEKYRVAHMAYRVANIAFETRSQVENLAAAFRERDRNDEARQALLQWIKSHEVQRKEDGVIGRLQLADEYLSLLNDEPTAVELLTDAYTIEPNFEDVKSKLTSLGYQWRNSRWMKTAAIPHEIQNPDPQAPSGIHIGLTATGLRTLLGQPRSLARAITSRGITEVWSFGSVGSSQLVFRLEKIGRDTEPKVTAFTGQ